MKQVISKYKFWGIGTVIYEDDKGKLIDWCGDKETKGNRVWSSNKELQNYGVKEYKEPRKFTAYMNIYNDTLNALKDGRDHTGSRLCPTIQAVNRSGGHPHSVRIGVVKIEWVEGEDELRACNSTVE